MKKDLKKKNVNSTKKTVSSKNVSSKSKTAPKKIKKQEIIEERAASDELRKLGILLVAIIAIICIFYIITTLVVKKNGNLKYNPTSEPSVIQYTDILASNILSKEGTYYVFVKDSENAYLNLFETYITSYESLEEHYDVYTVDLNNAFNKTYKSDVANYEASNLKFTGMTLLKIENGVIVETYDQIDGISNYLKSLAIEKS